MTSPIILTAMVLGIVQAFKIAGMPSKYSPLLAILIGVSSMLALEGISPSNAITGVTIGLSAVGLYSSGSHLGEGNKKRE